MSKVMWPLLDWSRKLASPSRPIICKTEPITIWLPTFSRAVGSLVGFTLSSHWLLKILSSILIGLCDYLSFCFLTLDWKVLYVCLCLLVLFTYYTLRIFRFSVFQHRTIQMWDCKTTLVFINLELQNWLKILDKCWLDYWIFLSSGLVIEH